MVWEVYENLLLSSKFVYIRGKTSGTLRDDQGTCHVNEGQSNENIRSTKDFKMLLCAASTALLVGGSRDRFPVVSLGIFSVAPPDGTMCPEVDSASESEYQGFLLG